MSFTLAQLRLEIQSIWHDLIPVISVTNAAASTTYITDTIRWTDSEMSSTVAGGYLDAKSYGGWWLGFPAQVTTARERRIGGNSGNYIDGASNGRVYFGGPALAVGLASGEAYYLCRIRPEELFNIIVNCLDQLLVATLQVLPSGTDLDMETSGVSNWSATNLTGGSSIKTTTAAKVYSGTQSLRVLLSGSGGNYQSATLTRGIIPGRQAFVSGKIQVDTAGPFYLQAYDVTNSAVIATSTGVQLENYVHVELSYTIPATCEQVAYRLLGTANLDDAYYGAVYHSVEGNTAPIVMPSWLNRETNLLKVMNARYTSQYASGVYDAYSRVFDKPYQKGRDYELRINPHHANPYTLEWRCTPAWDREIWMEALRPASDVYPLADTAAGEALPLVNLDRHMVALMVVQQAAHRILVDKPGDTQAMAAIEYVEGPKGKVGPLRQLLKEYERDLVTKQQQPVVLPTYRSWF